MCKLSIVIPVYGVENFIEDCIRSILENISTTLNSNDVEVIVVDDGSKDRSIEILEGIITDVPCFRVLRQNNQGLSMARNNGLQIAKGEYVWFVDSDDFISHGIVDRIIDYIKNYSGIDIFELHYQEVDEFVNREAYPECIMTESGPIEFSSGPEHVISGFHAPVQFHIFRKGFLEDMHLRMYPGIYHEDSEFTPRAIWLAQRIALLPEVAYYYRQRRNSIMSTVNPKKGHDCMLVAYRLQEFFKNQNITDGRRGVLADYISMTYCNGLNNAVGASTEIKKEINKYAIKYKKVLKTLRCANSIKYRILGYATLFFPRQITSIYLLMVKFKLGGK